MGAAEFIGYCVIGAVAGLAAGGAALALVWAIDSWLVGAASIRMYVAWSLRNVPYASAIALHGIKLWHWRAQVQRNREEGCDGE